jgi:hypothetical protein
MPSTREGKTQEGKTLVEHTKMGKAKKGLANESPQHTPSRKWMMKKSP